MDNSDLFTYEGYKNLLNILLTNKFKFKSFQSSYTERKVVVLRHDVDLSLQPALKIAQIEHEAGVNSTFFVFISTNFYNVFSKESSQQINEIIKYGHMIGLHFDESKYEISDSNDLEIKINEERKLLEFVIEKPVDVVSMHKPSPSILNNNIEFQTIINTYSRKFINDFKYVSDSRMNWKEDIKKIIASGNFNRLHILTHPIWYSNFNGSARIRLLDFVNNFQFELISHLKSNISNVNEFISESDLIKN